ncbi:NAD(P)H-binding protein [Allokutzneria sp. A3M-2-11 16]|uniref:NAD(P)H-binding protein n=1 Tax=Allokutzneria sp. A3M-2-11 16 TaxID=2962043 RepID=UPI0020B7EC11|nr:NAD(P)H-binding protein [Allokutzneria sp. A3M-2-11 16]MCP3802013.1 NAD(P)H-binding protein [Allokutzneria sp. A3M-2-11 16]
MKLLVAGATGSVGRQVVEQLVRAGAQVRALSRRPETAGLPAEVEVVAGDVEKPETLESAFDGVDRAYLLPYGETRRVVALAKEAGVQRIVMVTSVSAEYETEAENEYYRVAERAVEESGVEWTHVRPGMFMGNLLDWAGSIRATAAVREPYAAARQAPVDEVDIAAVAVTALLADGHHGKIYTLSGPESLTKVEQVAIISKAVGRVIQFEEVTPEQWRNEAGDDLEFLADWLLEVWAMAVEQPEPVRPTVQDILGRRARTLAEWAEVNKEHFR